MREIFGHVTSVISRIAHACMATWRRVMLHASLVLQSTDHSWTVVVDDSGLSDWPSPAADKGVQRLGDAASREYRPILYVPALRVISHIARSNYRITYSSCNASTVTVSVHTRRYHCCSYLSQSKLFSAYRRTFLILWILNVNTWYFFWLLTNLKLK